MRKLSSLDGNVRKIYCSRLIVVRDCHIGMDLLKMQIHTGDCPIDHGERTNKKLKDQPYHMRSHNGKMRKW